MKPVLLMSYMFFSFLLLLVGTSVCSQSTIDIIGKSAITMYEEEQPMFNKDTIRKHQIQSALIVKGLGAMDDTGGFEKKDTMFMYRFNIDGSIKSRTQFRKFYQGAQKVIDNYDTSGRQILRIIVGQGCKKQDSLILDLTNNSNDNYRYVHDTLITFKETVIKTAVLQKIKGQFDTTFYLKKVFNKQGKLLEDACRFTRAYTRLVSCTNGDSYHFKYAYDSAGRISFYQDFEYNHYLRITYPGYGKLLETFDAKTHKLIEAELVTTTVKENVIIRGCKKQHVVFTHSNQFNGLTDFITVVNLDRFPDISYYEVSYSTRNQNSLNL